MKAKSAERYELWEATREPSHVLALGAGRAVLVSRYGRRVALLAGGRVRVHDLAPLAILPQVEKADLAWRGAPFRCGGGFALAYADVLHLWSTLESAPRTLPVVVEDAVARRARGRLEPLDACAVGGSAAYLALHAGAASVHAAHRIVRLEWEESVARWTAGDLYLDLREQPGFESALDPATAPHPPAIQAIAWDGNHLLAHTTGTSQNHARYGMEISALVALDPQGRVLRCDRLDDGYASLTDGAVMLQRLLSKSGGLDFVRCDRSGHPLGELRITKKAMTPVEDLWLVVGACDADLWLADGNGHVVRFEVS